MTLTPFQIAVPSAELDDLRERLSETRWPDEIPGAKWDYGTNLQYLRELCRFWEREFDWRRQERELNAFRQFRAEIGGQGLHFIHEPAAGGAKGLPIVLCHGYPDSFVRFRTLIPLLTKGTPAFDVVVPSLPGFGFSDRPRERGMSHDRIAGLFLELMSELGYPRFVVHGGDWGAAVAEAMARRAPDRVLGTHQTEISWRRIFSVKPDELSDEERKYVEAGKRWQMAEGAYAMIQSTKPQSLAVAMNDSPAGLAAWMVEKFRSWSDCDGDVERRFSKDTLLTNLTIYWVTRTVGSAFRIYYEAMRGQEPAGDTKKVPLGLAVFPKEMLPVPRVFAERFHNVRRYRAMPRGGHFAAMEEPELLADELRSFFFDDLHFQ